MVASVAIDPDTVLKDYREMETRSLTAGRPGQGTSQATLNQVTLLELIAVDTAGLDESGTGQSEMCA